MNPSPSTDSKPPQPTSDFPISARLTYPALFLGFFAVALAVSWRALDSFFLGDDISLIYISSFDSDSWAGCFAPMTNGFWRPLHLLSTRLLARGFNLNPVAFHLSAVALHAAVGVALFIFVRRIGGFGARAAMACSILFLIHSGGWMTVYRYSHAADAMLALAILIGLIIWNDFLPARARTRFAAVLTAMALAFASKETGMVFGPILIGWAVGRVVMEGAGPADVSRAHDDAARSRPVRFPRMEAGVILSLTVAFAAWSAWNLARSEDSYLSGAMGAVQLSLNPIAWIRQICDYLVSTFVPTLHLLETPWMHPSLPDAALWAIRVATLLSLGAWIAFAAGRRLRFELLCAASGLALLALPAMRSGPPQSHYFYAPSAFFLAALIGTVRGLGGPTLKSAAALIWGSSLGLVFFFSPTIDRTLADSRRLRSMIESAEDVGAAWEKSQQVVIYNHPHPGRPEARWVYGQLLLWIYFPDNRPELAAPLDATLPAPAVPPALAYEFRDGELKLLDAAPGRIPES